MKNKKLLKYLAILSILVLTGCNLDEEYTDYEEVYTGNDNSSSSSSNTASCPSGTTSPYNDPQFDTQCETACAYLSSGDTSYAETICSTLALYKSIDVIASDCGACGNTSSASSNNDTSSYNNGSSSSDTSSSTNSSSNSDTILWNLCTRETSTRVYYQCLPYSGACDSGYSFYDSYSTRSSCQSNGRAWLNQYTKPIN